MIRETCISSFEDGNLGFNGLTNLLGNDVCQVIFFLRVVQPCSYSPRSFFQRGKFTPWKVTFFQLLNLGGVKLAVNPLKKEIQRYPRSDRSFFFEKLKGWTFHEPNLLFRIVVFFVNFCIWRKPYLIPWKSTVVFCMMIKPLLEKWVKLSK